MLKLGILTDWENKYNYSKTSTDKKGSKYLNSASGHDTQYLLSKWKLQQELIL